MNNIDNKKSININGVELEFDMYDLDDAERFENALDHVLSSMKNHNFTNITQSEAIKIQCNLIFDFIDTVFGKNTYKKIFGERVNLMTSLRIFEDIVNAINSQKKELDSFVNKYSNNRVQRRNDNKSKKNNNTNYKYNNRK